MTEITGREPKHWHDRHGRHRMPDPRPYGLRGEDADTRAYALHLRAHEEVAECPDRLPGDPETITALFDLIDARFAEIRKMRQLITALRQQAAATPGQDDLEEVEL
jgi:hypothetical protein